jgi:hypothetical protein
MEVEVATELITTVGFPIAVTVYLLFERNKGYKELCSIIEEDIKLTSHLCTLIESKLK